MSDQVKSPVTQPSKILHLSLGDNSYDVNFPTNGQLFDIEALKVTLSKDTHRSMLFNQTRSAELAYITIAAIATFTILIPDLKEDIRGAKGLVELSPIETKELVKVYKDVFFPWYEQWMNFINDDTITK